MNIEKYENSNKDFLISVIVPNYNHEQYLDMRLQSILKQTYSNFEIILLDDCSIDNSKSIIEKYRNNEHISHIVLNQHNSGLPFNQWEKGFELAKGELIWIAESDDLSDDRFLESMVECFCNDDVVLSFCRSMRIDEHGDEFGIYPSQVSLNSRLTLPGKRFIKDYLSRRNIVVNASSAVIKKDVIKKINGDYRLYRGCGDWFFWIYISEQGKVCYEDKPMNYFRQHINNTTKVLNNSGNNQKEVLKVYRYLSGHKYLNWYWKTWFRVTNLARFRSPDYFKEKSICNDVINEWNFSSFDFFLCHSLESYRKLKSFFKKNILNLCSFQ